MQGIESAERALERERGVIDSLHERRQKVAQRLAEAHDKALACEEASKLLAQFADTRQEQVISIIQNIASTGLSQIFDEEIKLKLTPVVRARRVELDVTVESNGVETPIMESRGGGLAAVAGLLLRITVLLLTKDARRLMILDEPLAHLSEDLQPRAAEFLKELCEKTGLQIIVVTHQPEMTEYADKVIRLTKIGGEAKLVTEK